MKSDLSEMEVDFFNKKSTRISRSGTSALWNALATNKEIGYLRLTQKGQVDSVSETFIVHFSKLFGETIRTGDSLYLNEYSEQLRDFITKTIAASEGKLGQGISQEFQIDTESESILKLNASSILDPETNEDFSILITSRFEEIKEVDNSAIEFYKDVLDNLPADIVVFNSKQQYIYINKSAVRNSEIREWLIGKDDFEYSKLRNIPLNLANERRLNFNKAVSTQTVIQSQECQFAQDRNERTWKLRNFNPIFKEDKLQYVIGYGIDITETINQKDFFIDIADKLDEIVFQLNRETQIEFISQASENILGLKKSEAIGKELVDFVCEDDKKTYNEAISRLSKKDESLIELEFRIVSKERGVIWVKMKAFSILNPSRINVIAGIISDIDLDKKNAEVLTYQRLAIQNSVEGVAILNAQNEYTYINKAHLDIFGFEKESEMLGKPWQMLYPPDEIKRIESEVFPGFIEQGYFRGLTVGITTKGKKVIQEISLTLLSDGGLICTTHDVTEELRRREEFKRLALVAEKTNSLVMITDREGLIQWVNDSFVQLTGYTLESVIGKIPNQILSGPETDQDKMREIYEAVVAGMPFKGEIQNYSKSGQSFWLNLDINPIRNEEGVITNFIAVQGDITPLKMAEEKALKALSTERQLNQFKSHFINLVSHEFRTPLATIQSSADIIDMHLCRLKNELPNDSHSAINRHKDQIQNEIFRMTAIMDNIILMGRLEAGKMPFNPSLELIDRVFSELLFETSLNCPLTDSIKIIVHGAAKPLLIDKSQLGYVFHNLMSNAIKYTTSGQCPEIMIHYNVASVKIYFKDHGIGIPTNDVQHLFTSFFRASNTNDIQGTGLGLVIVKQLVEINGGSIILVDSSSKGSTFLIEFPC